MIEDRQLTLEYFGVIPFIIYDKKTKMDDEIL